MLWRRRAPSLPTPVNGRRDEPIDRLHSTRHGAPAISTQPAIDIEVIGLDDRLAFLTDGRILPITNLFDEDGEETEDPDDAVSFVVMSGRRFMAFAVDDFEPLVRQ